MEIIDGIQKEGAEAEYLDEWTSETLIDSMQSLENIDFDSEFIEFFKETVMNDLKAMQKELISKQKHLNFQQSYMETQKKNQLQAQSLKSRCESLEKNLISLYSTKSALIETKAKTCKSLEENKTFFYSGLKKEFNSKALLESISTKLADVSQKQGQIINEIRDAQLDTIDHSTFVSEQILAPKTPTAPSSRPKPASILPLLLTIFLLLLLHIIY